MLTIALLLLTVVSGQSLTNFSATLDHYGIRNGARVMVLASKVSFFVVCAGEIFVYSLDTPPVTFSALCLAHREKHAC